VNKIISLSIIVFFTFSGCGDIEQSRNAYTASINFIAGGTIFDYSIVSVDVFSSGIFPRKLNSFSGIEELKELKALFYKSKIRGDLPSDMRFKGVFEKSGYLIVYTDFGDVKFEVVNVDNKYVKIIDDDAPGQAGSIFSYYNQNNFLLSKLGYKVVLEEGGK